MWSYKVLFNNLTDKHGKELVKERWILDGMKKNKDTISFNRISDIATNSPNNTLPFDDELAQMLGRQPTKNYERQNTNIDTHKDNTQAKNGERIPTSHIIHSTPSEPIPTITEPPRICPKLSLQSSNAAKYGLCTPHKPSEESCRFTQETYAIKPGLAKCKKRGMGDVCKMEINRTGKGREIFFICNQTLCKQGESDSFKVYSMDPMTGTASIVREFSTVKKLEVGLPEVVKKNKQNKFNFVFIECVSPQGKEVSQFVPIEPGLTIEETSNVRKPNLINVNVLLIDSIARAHFYRSLPRTVATFKKWRENPTAVPAKVFDFELFQALHGHTAENTHALFTGELFPIEKKDKSLPVNMSAIFGHFKRAGFHTMFQEDLCWKGIWGLMLDLGVRQWNDLQTKMKTTFIDHTGLTHSSCKILNSLGVDSPFSGPDGDQICYNGKFQHSYFLRYITDTLHVIKASRNALPLFSYMTLNVAHDHRSIRTQTLDTDLERYVTDMAKEENTLTIILADHGNTYTRYTSDVLEGRFEMFHPSLFMIVPDNVARLLGKNAMSALTVNQRRLVTMIDLHRSLMVLDKPLPGVVKPVGLFTPISLNRTCDDLELRTPNLCVCEGWDVPADNDTSRIPIAEFAIGQLNNRIQEQVEKMFSLNESTKTGDGKIRRSCQRLQPLWFENVRERNSKTDGALITSMNIRVASGDVVPQTEDIFHVEVRTKETVGENTLQMELLTYDRLTLFGKYSICADNGVDLKLCVCSQNARKTRSQITPLSPEGWVHFGQRPVLKKIDNTKCLQLLTWSYAKKNFNSYEVANFCPNQSYTVKIDAVESSNMKFSCELPLYLDVKPGSVLFALSVKKHVSYWNAEVKITATIEKKYIK
ncbi:hypothetical protein ACROYT_G027199 [Oculina patagonica]